MPEEYFVIVDGQADGARFVGRGRALGLAMNLIDLMLGSEVAVADARTLKICAFWHRNGCFWTVRAIDGWLPCFGAAHG